MRKEKILKYIGIFTVVFFLILGFMNAFGDEKRMSPGIVPPSLNKIPGLNFQIEMLVSQNDFPQQNSLPIYELSSSEITISTSQEIALNLGFSQNPTTELNDVNFGKILLWYKDDQSTLRIVPKQGIVEYKTIPEGGVSTDSTSMISETRAVQLANQFLSENRLLLSSVSLGQPIINYVVLDHEGKTIIDRNSAQYIDINYPLTINGYTIANATSAIGSINILMDKSGKIVSAHVNNIPEANIKEDYTLLNFDTFISNINQAELQMLDNGKLPIYQIGEGLINRIVVDSVTISYYEDNDTINKYLQPIYEIKGRAFLSDGRQVSALLFLNAIDYTKLR